MILRKVISIFSIRWIQHLLFWVLSFSFITFYYSISSFFKFIDFIYASFFHLCLFPLIYVLLRLLVPFFLEKDRYLLFAVGFLLNVGFAIGIHELVFDSLVPNLLTSYFIVSFTDYTSLLLIFSIYSIIALLLHLSKKSFRVRELESENLSLQLSSLKNQLNPHFLFNALNSIYSLSLKKDENAPKMILKLSGLLRFILEEVSENYIALSKEWDIIEKYIDIQKVRLESPDVIDIDLKGQGSPKIVPMLLFTLVENAFKHADLSSEKSFIKIKMLYNQNRIYFSISNTWLQNEKRDSHTGIGLENMQKRIDLIYGGHGKLSIDRKEDIFTAELTLDTL